MSHSDKALEAIMDWQKSTKAIHLRGPFFSRDFGDGMVILELKNWHDGLGLGLVRTPPEYRGKGFASRALNEIAEFADKYGVPITGCVSPQKGGSLNRSQITKWLKRHGFKVSTTGMVVRMPHCLTP